MCRCMCMYDLRMHILHLTLKIDKLYSCASYNESRVDILYSVQNDV